MKRIVLAVFLAIALTSPLAAEELVCFSQGEASKIVVEVEKCEILKTQKKILEQQNEELRAQIELLKQVIALKDQQLVVANESVKDIREAMTFQRKMYEEQLKQSKPSFIQKILEGMGFIGIGVLMGIVLL